MSSLQPRRSDGLPSTDGHPRSHTGVVYIHLAASEERVSYFQLHLVVGLSIVPYFGQRGIDTDHFRGTVS